MKAGDAVFAADGTHIGTAETAEGDWLVVSGGDHTYHVPRSQVAYERDGRVFLNAPNRAAAQLWRDDVRTARGLRGWWERRVVGPSSRRLGGPLHD